MNRAAGLLALAALGCASAQAAAQPVRTDGLGDERARRCSALAGSTLPDLPETPTRVVTARVAPAQGEAPATCQLEGTISGTIGFAVRLPLSGWNGKLIEVGCGALCGSLRHVETCADPLRRGYACAVTDGGHQSTSPADASWAYNNWQAQIDYFARANHVTALAAKSVTQRFYDRRPERAYFMGCSASGREAMMQAQRYPGTFDGIIAGDPSLNQAGIRLNVAWGQLAFRGRDGRPLFSPPDLQLLHQHALAQCDMDDGLKDGLIAHPQACAVRPAGLQCRPGGRTPCLTAEQVSAAEKLYAGPVTSTGSKIYMPGPLPGSEPTWTNWFGSQAIGQLVEEAFQYYVFHPSPGPGWKLADLDFDRDPQRMRLMEGLFSATNPDLRAFKDAGGKLIAYASLSDAAGMPLHTLDYYQTVERTMGGRAATQSFFRLFAIPGANHCQGGAGAWSVDYLSYLEDWVEKGRAPNEVIGSHPAPDGRPLFTRPHFPYPGRAIYRGRGDPAKASSFVPRRQDPGTAPRS